MQSAPCISKVLLDIVICKVLLALDIVACKVLLDIVIMQSAP